MKSDLDKILLKVRTFVQTDTVRKIDEYLKKEDFLNEEMFLVYLSYFPNPLPEKSLLHTHPDVSKEWGFKRENSPSQT